MVCSIQGNRNPFIDQPSFARLIWGDLNRLNEMAQREQLYRVSPNPASGFLLFRPVMLLEKGAGIEVFNSVGIRITQTGSHQGTWQLDLKSVPPGLYFYRITTAVGSQTGSFVKSAPR